MTTAKKITNLSLSKNLMSTFSLILPKHTSKYKSRLLLLSFCGLLFPAMAAPLAPDYLLRSSLGLTAQAQNSSVVREKQQLRIGVMAIRGKDKAISQWQAHMEYFARVLPEYDFELVPLGFDEIESTVENKKVDFVITNPGMYVNLEAKFGINRIVSLKNLRLGKAYTKFGAVILTKANRDDVNDLQDFKGKTFMGVKEGAFGGWQMAWDVFLDSKVDPYKHFKELRFGGSHDKVVLAVINGDVDGGTVRTDTLERMVAQGTIKLEDVKVINSQDQTEEFPFVHSTPLYPEWAFSAIGGLSLDIEEEMAKVLLELPPESNAAAKAKIEGWTVPLNYRPVHELFIDLKVAPYDDFGDFTTAQLLRRLGIVLAVASVGIAALTIYFQRRSLAKQRENELALNELNQSLEISAEEQRQLGEQQQKEKEQLELAIYTLIEEVADAADGDLTVRANLDSIELSTVADLFNSIIDNLQEIAVEARQSTGQVGEALKDNEVAMRSLAEQAIADAKETRNTLMSVERMSDSIQAVAKNASQAEKITDDTYNAVLQSTENMDLTVNSILELKNTVGETASKMKKLGESSKQISQALSLIEEISLKTNVLAINASAEAERAGEYGKGFSIVAEQVSSLAKQSSAATKAIAKVVMTIQNETLEVSYAMQSGTEQVLNSTELVESTKNSLTDVLSKSMEVNQLMGSISQTTVSQANTSHEVTTLIQKLADLSKTTSQSSMQVAKSIGETAQVAETLKSAVAQFKVAQSVSDN